MANKVVTIPFSGDEITRRLNVVETNVSNIQANVEAIAANTDADNAFKQTVEETYATMNYVDEKIAALVGEAPDALDTLSELAAALEDKQNITDLATLLAAKADKSELEDYQPKGDYLTEHQDLSEYAKTADVDAVEAKIDAILEGSDSSLDTLKELVDLINTKQSAQDVLDAIVNKADKSELANYQPKGDYLTEHQDLSDYATKAEVEAAGYLTEHQDLSAYATKEEITEMGYLTEHQDLSDYAKKEELPSLDNYLTESDAAATYQPKGEYLTEHQSLAGYATESYVGEKIAEVVGEAPEALDTLKEIADKLSDDSDVVASLTSTVASKANSADVYTKEESDEKYLTAHQSLEGYATEEFVTGQGYLTEHQDLSAYATKEEIDEAGYLTEHQDLSAYATKAEVEAAGYLTEHQDLTEYALKAELPSVEGLLSEADAAETYQPKGDYLTEHQSLNGYATEAYVGEKIAEVVGAAPEALDTLKEIGDALNNDADFAGTMTTALAAKADKSELEDYALAANVPSIDGLISEEAADEKYQAKGNYLTEHQDLSDYALKNEVPSIDGLISEEAADEKYQAKGDYLTEHQSLDDYATKAELPDLTPYALKSEVPSLEGYLTESDAAATYQPTGDYLVPNDLNGYATEQYVDGKVAEVVGAAPAALDTLKELGDALNNDADFAATMTTALAGKVDTSALEDYALKADVPEVVESWKINNAEFALKATEEVSEAFDYIYDEASWNASFENGALKKYYTKYPDEDRYNTQAHRWAYASDKVDGEWPDYCVQCWEGAISADGAKFPWVCPNFDEDVNAKIVFKYEGLDDVKPWGDNMFGLGRKADGGDRTWGIASVGEEFQNNSFLIPQQKNGTEVYNGNPEWAGTEGDKNFDINKFQMVLEHQPLAGMATEQFVAAKYQEKGEYLTEHQSLEGFATEEFVTEQGYLTEHQSLAGYATESYVDGKISDLINGADENLDTLKELADAVSTNGNGITEINTALNNKADVEDVYNKTAADGKFVDKADYDELNDKYTALFNYVYSNAQGAAATPLNAQYVENNLSNTSTSVEITEGELGDVTIPETTKTMSVTAPMQNDSTVTLTSSRSFNLINTSDEPVDVTIDAPENSSSTPTISLSGDFDDLTVNNGSISAKSGADPLTAQNVTVENEAGRGATVSGVVFGDDAVITTTTCPTLGVSNNNTSGDNNVPSATINAENSTVTMNKGEWNELTSNVGADTLIVTQNAHINQLNVVKGNVIVNDREISNRIGTVVNETEYSVSVNEHTATTGNELNSYLTGNPGIVNIGEDITRGRITWGIFGSGNYLLDLKGHTVTLSDANFGLKTRNTVNIKIVDTVGGGKLINDKSYGPWADEDGVITIDVPETTEIIGETHTLYAYGSRKPHINVIGGTYKMTIGDDETDIYDANGNYKFLLNHYDSTFTREGNCFTITGGTFYGFDPSRMNGDPGAEYSMVDLNNYEVQVVGTFVDSKEHTMNIYKVVAKA